MYPHGPLNPKPLGRADFPRSENYPKPLVVTGASPQASASDAASLANCSGFMVLGFRAVLPLWRTLWLLTGEGSYI